MAVATGIAEGAGNVEEESSVSEFLKRTPLFDSHVQLGAKMVPFAGWEMPVQYPAGLVAEHIAVREQVGIFDVSHMGEIFVSGNGTLDFLDYVTCNNPRALKDFQAQYSAFPNEDGGIVDDIILYRYSADRFLICVNASNADRDFEWLQQHKKGDVVLENASSAFAQIAVQGPRAFELLEKVFHQDLKARIPRFTFAEVDLDGVTCTVAATGYTGEDGVEIFLPPSFATTLWEKLLTEGASYGVLPCGLGARDSLRLEACYPLHGHELSPTISAIESGLSWIVKPEKKGEFIGRAILERQKREGSPRNLVGFFVEDKGIVREETPLYASEHSEEPIGMVTSGTKTPTIGKETGKALGLAIVDSSVGNEFFAEVRGKRLKVQKVETPFYRSTKEK